MAWPWNTNVHENLQPPTGCEMTTKYSAIFFSNLGEYIVEFIQLYQKIVFYPFPP